MSQEKNSEKNTGPIKEIIEKYRKKLLDRSKRNNLISFKHSERSRQHIRVIDELPDFLYGEFLDDKNLTFKCLPDDGQIPPDEKTRRFRSYLERAKLTDETYIKAMDNVNEDEESVPDKIQQIEWDLRNKIREELALPVWKEQKSLTNVEIAKKHHLNPSYEMPEPTPENQKDMARHIDKYIQTLLTPEEMDRKLSGLNSCVRSDIQESGVNTLHVAFGFLQWYESKNSDKPCISPLLLLQLEIGKKQFKKSYTYRVRATGEEPKINLSISELLRSDFGVELPEFTGEDTPERYMSKVANLIKNTNLPLPKKEKWRVRRFITIGRFRFARLVMYHDLSEEKWPKDTDVSTNKIVQNLLVGSENDSGNYSGNNYAEDYDIDTPEVEKTVPLLVAKADASQHSALVDVMKGKNLVIEGPPGTGKSQTITNIIANALAKGKTVLFLAEKMAALNVVHKRLSDANLGPYCLELHSTKAKKTEMLKSIKERIGLRSSRDDNNYLYPSSKIQEFNRCKDCIAEYIDVLNSRFGRQDKTIHDYLWAFQRRKDRMGDLHSIISQTKIPFEQSDLTKSELTEHTNDLQTIVSLKKDVDNKSDQGKHPWRFVGNSILDPFQRDELKQLIGHWAEYLEKMRDILQDFSDCFSLSVEPTAAKLEAFLDITETLAHWATDNIDQNLIANLGGSLKKAEALVTFVEDIHTFRSIQEKICTLKDIEDVSATIAHIQEIQKTVLVTKELRSDTLRPWNSRAEAKAMEEKLKLSEKSLNTLLEIGKCFDLSMLGEPHEIQIHAAAMENAGFLPFLDSSYRQSKKLYTLASKYKQKFNAAKAAETLREIAETKKEQQKIEQDLKKAVESKIVAEKEQTVKHLFGDHYAGADTNIQDVEQTARFIRDCLAVSEVKNSLEVLLNKDFSKNWRDFIKKREAVKNQHKTLKDHATQTQANIPIIFNADRWEEVPYSDLISLFKNALDKPDSLSSWIDFKTHFAEAAQDIKGKLLTIYDKEKLDFETLPLAFEYMIYYAVVRKIYDRNPVIYKTKGLKLEQARARIKELDQEISKLQKDGLCNALNKSCLLPGIGSGRRSGWTENALIHNEINKQQQHIPIRKLMERAGQSIQKIKPCFLMSPLTVAQYLEPKKFTFDLVVIDEASQMRPEDALGSIARAKQIIVVGDQKQLSPTSFFQSDVKYDENEEEDFASESIMDMALTSFRPSRILNRHYRSQHESLIRFSNYHFYDEKLFLFPSPVKNPHELGVRFEYVGGTYASNSNMDEVQAVTKAALDFMRKHPERSLGIAAMNQPQKDLIEIEMDRAFIDNSHAAKYKEKWQKTLESFFVKNLENVQGDERDAIFISTVYGPDKNGTVMQRFGPINRRDGHRRLNVLFTRAKKNMVVFTSLKPEDIKTLSSSSKGVRALKGFLTYAAKGVIDKGEETHRAPDSDFEICLKEKLESIGCEVHPQVGVSGYRIDLGVKHPKYPYGYLMGVECDGATYHSSKSARERDAIRQQILEGLGWRIYRIWSTDWFSNPIQEFEKLKNHIEKLINSEDLKVPKTDNMTIEHDFTPEDKEKGEPGDLFETAEKKTSVDPENVENVVELFDNITYFMIEDGEKKRKCSAQIVPTPGDPDAGTITQHSSIGRSLLGCSVGEEIECTLPMGEVTLEILRVEKYKAD